MVEGGGQANKRSAPQEGGKSSKRNKHAGNNAPTFSNTPAMPNGNRGILVTCDAASETRAGDEAIALIEEHVDRLRAQHPELVEASNSSTAAEETSSSDAAGSKDIAALIAAEVAGLKDRSKRRFSVYSTGVKGTLFVLFHGAPAYPDPVAVVHAIMEEARDTQVLRARHCSRILPMQHIGPANAESMAALAAKAIPPAFPTGDDVKSIAYSVDFEHRAAETFDRLSVINIFATIVPAPHKVNLNDPKRTILVQVLRNTCGVSVMDDYKHFHRCNIRRTSGAELPNQSNNPPRPKPKESSDPAKAAAAKAAKATAGEGAAAPTLGTDATAAGAEQVGSAAAAVAADEGAAAAVAAPPLVATEEATSVAAAVEGAVANGAVGAQPEESAPAIAVPAAEPAAA